MFHVGAALVAALRKGTHKRCPYRGMIHLFRRDSALFFIALLWWSGVRAGRVPITWMVMLKSRPESVRRFSERSRMILTRRADF